MTKTAVAALIACAVLSSCAKNNDVVAPISNANTQSQRTDSLSTGKKINLPLNGTSVYLLDANTVKYQPGDTLVVPKSVARVTLYKVNGTADKPVVITAAPGVVIGGFDRGSVDVQGKFIKLLNLNINGKSTSIGIRAYYCSDIALENIHIDGASIGVMLKNDAVATDPTTYYPNAIIRNVSLTNVSVKNCTNEGYYIGNTADIQNGYKNSPIIGLTVKNCSAENTGWDGFQVTSAQNCFIDGVTVINAGTANKDSQMSGITIQDATTGTFQNFTVNKSTGAGLTLFSMGNLVVKNVAIQDATTTAKSYGIIVDNRPDRGFNLPAKKLIMENVSIKQSAGFKGKIPLYVINSTANGAISAVPGTVTNFTYDLASWEKKTVDNAKDVFYGGNDGAPIASTGADQTVPVTNALPGTPASFTAGTSSKTVTLSWAAPANTGGTITSYKIYRGTTAGKYNLIRTTTGTTLSYVDGNKVTGTTYYYVISAVNAKGEGALSAPVAVVSK